MATDARYKVPYRRKRKGKTDYRKRLKLLLSRRPRLVVRKTSKHIILQLIESKVKGDRTIASSHSKELKKYGWKGSTSNLPSAYLTGFLCGTKAVKQKFKEGILDLGLATPTKGSRLFAALKGALDAGMDIPHKPEILPSEDRISGKHIENYAKVLKEAEIKQRFSKYVERGLKIEELSKHFDEVKHKIGKV